MKETRKSVTDIWGARTPYQDKWVERIDERTLEQPEKWVQSACILCSNGCGMDIGVKENRIVGVRGRGVDRVNLGRLGPKGLHGWVANHSTDRLTYPLIRRDGALKKATWDEAMGLLVRRSKDIWKRYTSSAIGLYTTGQLFLEEYYTLAVIGKAGLATPHMDGNTRLCTATAAMALIETFGSDGQPGSYSDIDVTDAILLVGHNAASQQTVLWMRILDRLEGSRPPALIVIDPRKTDTAKRADVHLAPRVGTNVALLNGILNLIIKAGRADLPFIKAHTVGFEKLKETVARYEPRRVAQITGVPFKSLEHAAEILGTTRSLVSTVLQGVYQSMQATEAAVQVNNINLIRGLIGRAGCGILQMNGQPTAQNTRETGCDGELPAFRNWANPNHINDLARIWNVDPELIPHWAPPTHAMEIFRYAEQGSIKFLWIIATNPAVSLPELPRIRKILRSKDLFLVVQDAFLTETAKYADVLLPAAIWGEKTGCLTNTDRTVHISHKAIDPPGEAKSDLDIFLEYAKRMSFTDKDGGPLIKWHDPQSAFEAWKECSRGAFCDYSGITYDKLSRGSGIQWPCNDKAPNGTERLYTDLVFRTAADVCEVYGHNLETGAAREPQEYKANDPQGKAFLKAAEYQPPHELPDEKYPLFLTTGRVVHHWHTRTKTARSRELNEAAPEVFVQISEEDARQYGLLDGDLVELESRRGKMQGPIRIGKIQKGLLFVPFHYGYWDNPGFLRAANELTVSEWDPVSKQPHYKYAAVRMKKIKKLKAEPEDLGEKAKTRSAKVLEKAKDLASREARGRQIGAYIGMVHMSEERLAEAFQKVAKHHKEEPDVFALCTKLSFWSYSHVGKLKPFIQRYKEQKESEPKSLRKALFHGPRSGSLGLLRDLHDLWLMANESHISWIVLLQAARGLRDKGLEAVCESCDEATEIQMAWILTRIKQAAPQILIVPK